MSLAAVETFRPIRSADDDARSDGFSIRVKRNEKYSPRKDEHKEKKKNEEEREGLQSMSVHHFRKVLISRKIIHMGFFLSLTSFPTNRIEYDQQGFDFQEVNRDSPSSSSARL